MRYEDQPRSHGSFGRLLAPGLSPGPLGQKRSRRKMIGVQVQTGACRCAVAVEFLDGTGKFDRGNVEHHYG
ncbi:hypothetical protein D3C76_944250 [compost metagenome]